VPIDLQVRDNVAFVTIDRPEALNALDNTARRQLIATWAEVESRPDIRVAVLSGAGDRAFCVGSDLKEDTDDGVAFAAQRFGGAPDPHLLTGLPEGTPVIAAIRGYALGGGFEIALACDIRIAADDAILGLPEVSVGSMPGAGGTQNLTRAISRSDAMYLLLTGERIDAQRALEMRLVSEVVAPDALLERAEAIAQRIASNAPLSVNAVKRLAQRSDELPRAVGLELERSAFGLIRATEDRLEGRRAFREKRPTRFEGR
jgi:E-phenylitaconyl-CoA hydratase